MSHRKTSLGLLAAATLIGSLALAQPTFAADLDAGYGEPAPVAEEKVEFGSGWYIRGDIAATQIYEIGAYQPPNSRIIYRGIDRTHDVGYDLSAGGGYKFTNSIRADITADFHQPISSETLDAYCFDSSAATCVTDAKLNHYDALINVYYDFGTWSVVTPYVGAGVGVAFGQAKSSLTGTDESNGNANNYGNYVKYHNLAWALMAGIAIDVYDHTKLDIGYRYLNNGSILGTNLYYHEIRAGLRYMIDN